MNTTISILAEIPEGLHEAITRYLESHPAWDQDRIFAAALSLFLLQNGECNYPEEGTALQRRAARVYLDALYQRPV